MNLHPFILRHLRAWTLCVLGQMMASDKVQAVETPRPSSTATVTDTDFEQSRPLGDDTFEFEHPFFQPARPAQNASSPAPALETGAPASPNPSPNPREARSSASEANDQTHRTILGTTSNPGIARREIRENHVFRVRASQTYDPTQIELDGVLTFALEDSAPRIGSANLTSGLRRGSWIEFRVVGTNSTDGSPLLGSCMIVEPLGNGEQRAIPIKAEIREPGDVQLESSRETQITRARDRASSIGQLLGGFDANLNLNAIVHLAMSPPLLRRNDKGTSVIREVIPEGTELSVLVTETTYY